MVTLLSRFPPGSDHVQVRYWGKSRRSWRAVPVALVERSTRIPSASVRRSVPARSWSIVSVSSAAGEKALGPSTASRTIAAEPWPSGLNDHPWRPRPTSTQPPPSVAMSQ
ncbi:MAG: hypothetical protein R2711_06985 [Acidimicrobiales bacterium]